jgi:hypothetical protein
MDVVTGIGLGKNVTAEKSPGRKIRRPARTRFTLSHFFAIHFSAHR